MAKKIMLQGQPSSEGPEGSEGGGAGGGGSTRKGRRSRRETWCPGNSGGWLPPPGLAAEGGMEGVVAEEQEAGSGRKRSINRGRGSGRWVVGWAGGSGLECHVLCKWV